MSYEHVKLWTEFQKTSQNLQRLMNGLFKADAFGECELILEGYKCKDFPTIPLPVFRKFIDYRVNFKRSR